MKTSLKGTVMKFNLDPQPRAGITVVEAYAERTRVPATMLFAMGKQTPNIAMEDYANKSAGLIEELRNRRENFRFVLKQFKTDIIKLITIDQVLNRKIRNTPYTTLMDVDMLNPIGLRMPLRDYAELLFKATELSKLTIAKVIPQAKVFFAEISSNNELVNNRPIDSYSFLELNSDRIQEYKGEFSRALDSTYENPTTTFGQQFKRAKDWDETSELCKAISANLNDISKQDLTGDVKELSELLDRVLVHVRKEADKDQISETNIKLLKRASAQIAEEVSFLGAVVHLADTFLNVMEDNKEFLRDFLSK